MMAQVLCENDGTRPFKGGSRKVLMEGINGAQQAMPLSNLTLSPPFSLPPSPSSSPILVPSLLSSRTCGVPGTDTPDTTKTPPHSWGQQCQYQVPPPGALQLPLHIDSVPSCGEYFTHCQESHNHASTVLQLSRHQYKQTC